MIYELKNVVDATQITQAMFDGKEPVPKCCYRFSDVMYGKETGMVIIWFIPHHLHDRMQVKVGDWVIDSIFATKVLTDEEFKRFVNESSART